MTTPALTMNDGHLIPQIGFGTFKIDPFETAEVVSRALQVGYRHIDTAQMYGNEQGVGEAVRTSGISRDEVFVTTKLNNPHHRPDDVRRSFDESLATMGLDRIDLFLIHWPLPTQYDGDYVSTWRAMTELVADGRVRSVGVSNFEPNHLARIIDETGIVPAVNQVEVHPYFDNTEVRAANAARGVLTEAWSPIARGAVTGDPVVKAIADRVGRSETQVALRWHLQRGDIVFPKTVNTERMRANLEVTDFELTDDDLAAISALDKGAAGRTGPDPATFDWLG
ncbi:aldo/keto reductase [Nocardioides alcanivorans]|uniref:aldo/keto reductase n=1 Tax=Nocardioides alcanivorans TaxID=2897352 RepID=UPI001F290D09|nr:aldo/keto reductase [Nocardioides alcanivorans]